MTITGIIIIRPHARRSAVLRAPKEGGARGGAGRRASKLRSPDAEPTHAHRGSVPAPAARKVACPGKGEPLAHAGGGGGCLPRSRRGRGKEGFPTLLCRTRARRASQREAGGCPATALGGPTPSKPTSTVAAPLREGEEGGGPALPAAAPRPEPGSGRIIIMIIIIMITR